MNLEDTTTESSSGDEFARYDPLDDDIVAHTFIGNQQTLQFEVELFSSKWFDYRCMTPLQATRVYIQAYDTAFRRHYAANIDHVAAKHVRTVSIDGIFDGLKAPGSASYKKAKSNFTACWHGRQMADLMGMPYETYLDLAFEVRLRYWNRPYLPQPQHLYSDMITDRLQARWEELQASRLYTSDHPLYHQGNYQDLPHQNDYHEWLFKQAWARANPAEMISRFVRDDMIPYEKVEARLTYDILDNVKNYLN